MQINNITFARLVIMCYNYRKNSGGFMNYIIFDMDGVLVNSEPVIMHAAADALASGGIKGGREDFMPYIGAGEENFIIGPCTVQGKPELIDELMERMFENFENNIADMQVFPSAKPLTEELKRRGFTLALVSSAASRKLTASLKAAGINPEIFSVILSGSDVTEKKPSPMPYLLAAKRLGADPKECLVIEDAISGVKSAKSAGMKCFGVTTSFSEAELKTAGANFVGDDIIKVLDLLD